MNLRMKSLFRRLMDVADDNGSAGVVDRGDTVEPVVPEVVEPAVPTPEELAAEELAAKPRDADGKFAKKEPDEEPRIPKSRFDEQIGKERARSEAAERRLAEIEQQQASLNRGVDLEKAAADVADLRKQERAALLDGNEEKAGQLSAQADMLNRRIAIAEAGHLSSQDKAQALEDMRMELTIERMEEKYPVLNSNADEFDQELVDDILDKQTGIMQRERLSPSKALAKAVEAIMRRSTLTSSDGERAGLGAAKGGSDRKADAVARNVAASKAQPGSTSVAGMDSDKAGMTKAVPNPKDLSFAEFEALSEKERSIMRGDTI